MKKAFELYSLGVDEGFPRSLFSTAYFLQNGYGVIQDLEEAFLRYEEAAALGHNDAICALGECYEYGQGIRQDYQRALHYCEKAAYEGNSLAKYKLGRFYDLGYGCNENYQKAFHWYQEAAKDGLEVAITAMATCYEFGRGIEKIVKSFRILFKSSKYGLYECAILFRVFL